MSLSFTTWQTFQLNNIGKPEYWEDIKQSLNKYKYIQTKSHFLKLIIEQSLEWNLSLHIAFIDFQKAFDTLDQESLWKLMQHYTKWFTKRIH